MWQVWGLCPSYLAYFHFTPVASKLYSQRLPVLSKETSLSCRYQVLTLKNVTFWTKHFAESLGWPQWTQLDDQGLCRNMKTCRPEERTEAGGTFSCLFKVNSLAYKADDGNNNEVLCTFSECFFWLVVNKLGLFLVTDYA